MARYQHLPVFQATYDLVLEIHKRVEKFPRVHRYSIGEKLKDTGNNGKVYSTRNRRFL